MPLKKSKGASLETWEFGYDVTNRLIAVSKRATDGGTLQLRVDYKYDALGRRIERYEDTNGDGNTDVRERFGYDGEHVWADLDGSNNLTYRRLFGEGIDTPEARVSAGGTVVWYLRDYQNSVIGMVDSSGTSLGARSYSGYGQELSDTLGASGDRYGYTAREEDASTGLSYYRARFYDPALGRWISTDPIGFTADDANLYRYVANGPTNGVDPSGLEGRPIGVSSSVPFAGAGWSVPGLGGRPSNSGGVDYNTQIPNKPTLITSWGIGGNVGPVLASVPPAPVKPLTSPIIAAIHPPLTLPPAPVNATAGTHVFFTKPKPGTYVGTAGTNPCVGVIIICPDGNGAVFHLSCGYDSPSTISQYQWAPGSIAIVFGGGAGSGKPMQAYISALQSCGITVTGFNGEQAYVGSDGSV